jgi:hypothetical protein
MNHSQHRLFWHHRHGVDPTGLVVAAMKQPCKAAEETWKRIQAFITNVIDYKEAKNYG